MVNKGPKPHPQHPKPGKDPMPKGPGGKIIWPGDISDQDPKRRIGNYGGTGEPHMKQDM